MQCCASIVAETILYFYMKCVYTEGDETCMESAIFQAVIMWYKIRTMVLRNTRKVREECCGNKAVYVGLHKTWI
jgi:hypothetical protein